MADDLSTYCVRLHLQNDKEDVVDLSNDTNDPVDDKLSLHLVGKLLTAKPINFEALKRTMTNVLNLHNWVVMRSIDVNTFIFQFFHCQDKEKVMSGHPWCFEQRLLLLQEISNFTEPSEVNLNYSPFWVRFYNLPIGFCSDDKFKAIASSIGEVMEIEEDVLDIEPFHRVRIMLNILKPLKQSQKVRVKGDHIMQIGLKYERY